MKYDVTLSDSAYVFISEYKFKNIITHRALENDRHLSLDEVDKMVSKIEEKQNLRPSTAKRIEVKNDAYLLL